MSRKTFIIVNLCALRVDNSKLTPIISVIRNANFGVSSVGRSVRWMGAVNPPYADN